MMDFDDDFDISAIIPLLDFQEEKCKKMDEDFDYAYAVMLQSTENDVIESDFSKPAVKKPLSLVDAEWENLDPNPNILILFQQFNCEYFYGVLESVVVSWSKRMTLCAGLCYYEGRGGLCSIKLSQPLLQLRPRKDLIETLLHEMIHAYLFVTQNNKDHDGHGPEFQKHMNRLNRETGTNITIYHNFHDEVDYQRKHWWKCDGPCQKRRPYFGIVKRSMNRAPSPRDTWWAVHQAQCGGTFVKFKSPEDNSKKKIAKGTKTTKPKNPSAKDIRSFYAKSPAPSKVKTLGDVPDSLPSKFNDATATALDQISSGKAFVPFSGTGYKLNAPVNTKVALTERVRGTSSSSISSHGKQEVKSHLEKMRSLDRFLVHKVPTTTLPPTTAGTSKQTMDSNKLDVLEDSMRNVPCPVCTVPVFHQAMNEHLDHCLSS